MNNKYNSVAASLRLFNCVLATADSNNADPDSFEIIKEYGVIVAPSAISHLKEINLYLNAHKVSDKQFNQTFYSTADEVEGKTLEERLCDQLTHYFSTYGLRAMGIESDFMFVPHNWDKLNLPERIKFEVIVGVPAEGLIERCLNLLSSGVALKQETIEDILTVLDDCGYKFDGNESIKNNEARVIIADRTGVLPKNGEDLFRFIFYKATNSSLVINNSQTLDSIKFSRYSLPDLAEGQIRELAKSFNRRKPYWMALKAANRKANTSVVNKIAKLSKKLHEPLPFDVLGNLTNTVSEPGKVEKAIQKANTFRLIRALNAVNEYALSGSDKHFYRIRNGKGYIKQVTTDFKGDGAASYELEKEIKARINTETTVYIPEGVTYALPSSEKQFSTNIPNFSSVEVDADGRELLVGIYWENSGYRTDFDLSCESLSGSRIGWNSSWYNSELVYSGDITNAPNGAAEWFVVRELKESWLLSVNLYSGGNYGKAHPFKIMVGYGESEPRYDKYRNYFIRPENVLFVAEAEATQTQTILGVLSPCKGKTKFTLVNRGGNNRRVSMPGGLTTSTIEALLPQVETCATLNQFVTLCDDPAKADLDLSPNKVSRDSILSLIRPMAE